MSKTIGTAQIDLSLDSSGVEAGVKASKKAIESVKDSAVKTGKEASAGLGLVTESTDKLDAATKRAQRSIELQTLAIGKSRSEFLAAKAAIDGNSAALAPYIARLAEAERAAQKTGSSLSGLKSMAIGALGAIGVSLSVSAFTGMIEGAAKAQAGLQQLAERTNSTVESLSGLKSVAKLSGTDMEQVATAIQKMSRNMADASPAAMNAFKAIGVSSKEMAQGMRDPAAMLQIVARHLDGFRDSAEKTAAEMAIFGKAGANLGPLFHDLAEQGELVTRTTTAQALAADALEKTMVRWDGRMKGVYSTLAGEVVPVLDTFMKSLLASDSAASGLTETAKKYAADGSIRTWAETAASGVSMLMDVLGGVSRVVETAGTTLAAFASRVATIFGGMGDILTSNMRDAPAKWRSMQAQLVSISETQHAQIENIWTRETFSQSLAAQFKKTETAQSEFVEKSKSVLAAYKGYSVEIQQQAMRALAESSGLAFAGQGAGKAALNYHGGDTEGAVKSMDGYYRAMAAMEKAAQDSAAASIKNGISQQIAALDAGFAQRMISEQGYFTQKEALEKRMAEAEVARIQSAIRAEQAALEKTADKTKKVELATKIIDLNKQLASSEDAVAKVARDATTRAIAGLNKEYEEMAKELGDSRQRMDDLAESMTTANRTRQYELSLMGMDKDARQTLIEQYRIQLDLDAKINAERKKGNGIDDDTLKRLREEADIAKGLAQQLASAQQWEKMNDEINRSLTDALMRGFESGKDFASSFKDSVVNMFKTMVLRPVVSAIVQPVAGAVTGALGSLGLPGMAQAAGTQGAASLLGNAGSSLLGNAGAAVFGNSTAYGLGVSGLSLGGEQAAMLAAQTAEFGAAGLSATAGAAGGGGLMATIGTALPWIGGALLVASLLDKHGGPKTGGYSGDFSERFYTPTESDGQAKTLIDGLRAQIGASLGAFGKTSSGIKLGVGFDTDPQGTAADRISSRVTVGGKTVLDSGKEFGRGTLEQNLPGEIERMFLAAMKAADVHPVVNALLDGMAIDTAGADQLKVMAEAVASASSLLGDGWQRAFGPLKTAAEDLQAKWADVAGAGQPSLLALKDLVLGLDLTTEAGRASAQSLLGLTSAIQAQETAALALIGATRESIAQDLYQALANSPDAASAGEMFASSVVGGIQNALVNTYTQQISDLMISGIITPAIDALLTGASVSEALSQANMDAILKQAQAYSDAFSAIWGDQDFQDALGQIKTSIKGVVGAVAPTLQPAIHAARPVAPVVVEPVAKPDDTASKTADLSRQRRALEISLMEAEGHALEALAAKRADELAALDDSLKPLQQRLYDLQDAADAANKAADAQKALNAAQEAALAAADKLRQSLISVANDAVSQQFNALQRAVDAEKESATEAYNAAVEKSKTGIDKLATSVDKFKRLADSLKSALDKMTPPNASPALQRQEAQAQIEAALAIAQAGGPLPDQDAIARALDTVSQNNSDLFATALDANRDFYRAFNSVSKLSDLTGKQLTVEDKALQAAQTANDLLKKSYEAEISRLDGVLDSARAQIDALNGINTSVVSVATAIANLAAALQVASIVKQTQAGDRIEGGKYISSGGAVYNGATGGITTPSGAEFSAVAAQQFVSGVVGSVTAGGLSAAAGVTAIYDAAVASGISAQSLDGLMGWTPGTSNAVASEYGLKKFAVGTNYIPEDMPAIVHRGERIIPAADNAALMERLASPAQSNAALVNEVRALRAELAQLRAEQRAANGAIAQNTMDSAKLSRKWDADGIPETRTL